MGGTRRRGRRLAATTMVLATSVAFVAPAAGAADASGRTLPEGYVLRRSIVSAFATASTPYLISEARCGATGWAALSGSPYVTLYAYGADGGGNGHGTEGGLGAVAVASYAIPISNPNFTYVHGTAGCRGQAARPDAHDAPKAGDAPGVTWTRPGLGGDGGVGAGVGESGGAGGGNSVFGSYAYAGALETRMLVAGGGGGAGGGPGGGAGGDGSHDGKNASVGNAARGRRGIFSAPGAGGVTSANGTTLRGGKGAAGTSTGGGGGGGGYRSGGGGAPGVGSGSGGGGGGGGHSVVWSGIGYWVTANGTGHGEGGHGLAQVIKVAPITRTPTWPRLDVVRGIAGNGGRAGGWILEKSGVIRTYAQGVGPAGAHPSATWPGFDIARGIASLPDGKGGYVVDLYGRLHPFRVGSNPPPPRVTGRAIWPGRDMARGVTVLPDGTGGYVLGRNGSMIPFAIGSNPKPRAATGVPSWPGYDVARGVTSPFLDGNGHAGGYVVDLFGRLHPWGRMLGGPTLPALGPTHVGTRGVVSFVGGAAGIIIDGAGTMRSFASPGLP